MKLIPIGIVVAVLVALPFLISGYHQGLATHVAIYFIAILGLNILTGYTGQISIGHGAFMAIGGYTTALLSADQHWSLLATLPASLGITFVCGLLVGVPALRLSGVYLALATFALAVSVPQFPLKFSKFLGGSNGLHTSDTATHLWLYVVGWSCAAILFAAAWLLLRGRIGRAFRAVRDSELAATSSGVSLPIYKTFAFGVSAAFAGVAGSLFVIATNGYVQPGEFGVLLSLQILIGAAVAGLGSLWGVLVGALFIGLLPSIAPDVPLIGSSHGQDVVFGLIVVLIMLLLPNGFAGFLRRFEPRVKTAIKSDPRAS
ncbi:MAG: branched-chain amino acid transport system permease protein [Gaiellaceae bacterium]|jgi:branched-chain amino acid transport system permease protein|nr:branched-chain amino acid transport system permease protein [Gaiellaceae bacterium]